MGGGGAFMMSYSRFMKTYHPGFPFKNNFQILKLSIINHVLRSFFDYSTHAFKYNFKHIVIFSYNKCKYPVEKWCQEIINEKANLKHLKFKI